MNPEISVKVALRDRFRILYAIRDQDLVDAAFSSLEYGVARIERVLKTRANIPFVNLFLCKSRVVFDDFVRVFKAIPTHPGSIGAAQGHDLYILSPKSYASDAPHYGRNTPPFYDPIDFRRILTHELVHLWEELSSPKEAMDEGDDWFSEGMAMHISEWCWESRQESRLRADYSNGIIPEPDAVSGEQNYTWGCMLFEFLLREVGPKPILEMVEHTNHRHVIQLLGIDQPAFWKRYLSFVHLRLASHAL